MSRSVFNRNLPLWYQLSQMLRSEILGGQLAAGDRVPPEVELARRHGVSVVTVRQALRALDEEGLILRQRGRGTFVTPGPHHHKELRLMGRLRHLGPAGLETLGRTVEERYRRVEALCSALPWEAPGADDEP